MSTDSLMMWSEDANEWQPDVYECEPTPDDTKDPPWLHCDSGFPSWCNPHLDQLQQLWSLCREYCRVNHLPLLDDRVTFAAFCRSLSPLQKDVRNAAVRRRTVTAPVRFITKERSGGGVQKGLKLL